MVGDVWVQLQLSLLSILSTLVLGIASFASNREMVRKWYIISMEQ